MDAYSMENLEKFRKQFKQWEPASYGIRELLHELLNGLRLVVRCFGRRLGTRLENILKTSWRRLEDVPKMYLEDILQPRLEDVLQDEKCLCWRRLQDVFKMSWKTRNVYKDNLVLHIPPKMKIFSILAKSSWKKETELFPAVPYLKWKL